ncbi:MAG TPA: sigma-70 family RNA polymerase sigma factor [Chthonomonadaceae bacterium]|nr:sigma-70 family RNA polymerase sigma factor [Chthonomonadaceae bacterium]
MPDQRERSRPCDLDALGGFAKPTTLPRLPRPVFNSPRVERLDPLLLIERCKAGDPAAWNELIHRYEGLIYSFARSLCHNAADASDVAAQVLLRLYQSLHTFRNGAPFKSWLFRIVRNTYIDDCVRDSENGHLSLDAGAGPDGETVPGREVVDPAPSPETICLEREMVRRLAEGIHHLPAYQRQVLALYARGRSYEEIAQATGVSMGTVKSRLNRARRTLHERLEC